ncbi:hypothetical protein, partial [Rhodoferax sp.]|uniref:hypothetical protein n=1 Tax=Rhodoferax sp. TaxID=50421 RepID=UPI00274FF847|nr:hypothetical protein [Rhodoferax sp.]
RRPATLAGQCLAPRLTLRSVSSPAGLVRGGGVRSVNETVPDDLLARQDMEGVPLVHIDQRIEQGQHLLTTLKAQGRGGPILEIVETALARLNRLHVAWNAMGFWGVQAGELSGAERFELELADKELQQRLSQLQRECLLLSERLGQLEKTWIEPLWRGVLLERRA